MSAPGDESPDITTRLQLAPDQLRPHFDLDGLPETTADVQPLTTVHGQDRAREAIRFGLAMDAPGYNIAVSGPPASARTGLVLASIREVAPAKSAPPEWVYLFRFNDPRRPRAVSVPPGAAAALKRALQAVADGCRNALPAAFLGEAYEARATQLLDPTRHEQQETLEALQETGRGLGFAVNFTPAGPVAAPLARNGQPMTPEVFAGLPKDIRDGIEERGEKLQAEIAATVRKVRQLETAATEKLAGLDREITRYVLGNLLDDARETCDAPAVREHVDAIESDIVEHVSIFKQFALRESMPPQFAAELMGEREALLQRYGVTVLVEHAPGSGAPVVEVKDPTRQALMGRIEFENRMGVLATDFTHIRPGALVAASGGFLVLDAPELLTDAGAWQALKQVLKTGEVRLDQVSELLPLATVTMNPDPVPVAVKVVLIGPPMLLALLDAVDPDFAALFKVRAEFEPDAPAALMVAPYAAFVANVARECGLRPFHRDAVAGALREGARLVGRQDRVSTRLGMVADLCREADHFAAARGSGIVAAEDVDAAVAAREHRSGLLPDRLRELVVEGTLRVETSGSRVGQVNGLAVYATGGRAFGTPVRISCRVAAGRQGVVAIERETERSGAIHTKGVLVLSGFLNGMFGRREPLSFNASLTFEQSYDEVDGDSASAAELCAILAALAEVPVRQEVAMTGSVDQFGNIQAVGGVTEKVEGFFDVCRAFGLTGRQGVVLPAANVINLTLRDDVIAAVEQGTFHLWQVRRIEEALELLTGMEAGESGEYPPTSIFGRAAAAVEAMTASARTRFAG